MKLPFGSVPVARNTDPATSHAAAASVQHVRESQAAVLRVLRAIGPSTDEEIAVRYEAKHGYERDYGGVPNPYPLQSPSGLRTRRKELVRAGLVEDSGERRRLHSGRKSIVWRAT